MIAVCLTHTAIADLEAIGDYIARDNPRRALSFVQELRERCLGLADMPEAFPLVARYPKSSIRHRVHGRYQIFYRVVGAPAERIDILHVLHSARDTAAILFGDLGQT